MSSKKDSNKVAFSCLFTKIDLWESHSLSTCYQRKADIFSLVWFTTCVTWDKASSFSRLGVLFGETWVSATPMPWNPYQDGTWEHWGQGLCKKCAERQILSSISPVNSPTSFWVHERPLVNWSSSNSMSALLSRAQGWTHGRDTAHVPKLKGAEVDRSPIAVNMKKVMCLLMKGYIRPMKYFWKRTWTWIRARLYI